MALISCNQAHFLSLAQAPGYVASFTNPFMFVLASVPRYLTLDYTIGPLKQKESSPTAREYNKS